MVKQQISTIIFKPMKTFEILVKGLYCCYELTLQRGYYRKSAELFLCIFIKP